MNTVECVSIQPIDKATVNQICSGQVVLSLATAVKELLENCIDAGADVIQIKLEEYGSESIEVIDNGCGVDEVNFQALTLKHHTSKIKEFSDLYSVKTFGFRGEALSSLCSLSDVTIITQHKNAQIGATLKFDHNGLIISNVKTFRKVGTTVRLENLFVTLPIRRTEFLKNLKKEYSKMCNVLYAYGLLSKGVRITCTNNVYKSKLTTKECGGKISKRSTVSTIMDTKGDSFESNIISIFGIKQKQNLLQITETTPTEATLNEFNVQSKHLDLQKFKLNGYISSCAHGCGRSSSDRQYYYINSRPVDNPKISKLVNEIYHQYNNRQDPFVVLNFQVACGSFDINLTPDKRQILLTNEKVLLAVLKESLSATFQNVSSTLELQNVRSSKAFWETENTKPPERLEKFKASFISQEKSRKKEQTQSRIDSLYKFRLNRSSLNSSTQENDTKNKIKIDIPKADNGIFMYPTPERNSPETEIANDKTTFKPTRNNIKTPEEVKSSNESFEYKRKITESVQEEIPEEIDSKRMKFDDGLDEKGKKNRKIITCDVTISDIKKNFLKNAEPHEETEKSSKVKFLSEIKPQSNERAVTELKKELKKESFSRMEVIGQFNVGFIITKLDSDIFIIDQHASDEKYNYETLQATTVMQTQKLFNPEKLELTVEKEELMLQHKEVFNKNGFDFVFDKDGPSTKRISLTSIPLSKNYVFGKGDVDELLFLLEDAPSVNKIRPSRVSSMFASRACRKSVMIGTPLNHCEMKKIVQHMGEMEHPWNCPHGRPTMRHLINLQMIRLNE